MGNHFIDKPSTRCYDSILAQIATIVSLIRGTTYSLNHRIVAFFMSMGMLLVRHATIIAAFACGKSFPLLKSDPCSTGVVRAMEFDPDNQPLL